MLFAQMQCRFKFQLNFKVSHRVNSYFDINFSKIVLKNEFVFSRSDCVCFYLHGRVGVFWPFLWWLYPWNKVCQRAPTKAGQQAGWTFARQSRAMQCTRIEPERRRTISSQTSKWHLGEWAKEASSLHFNKTPFLLQERGQRLVC